MPDGYVSPACGRPAMGANSLCSGGFTDENHPPNVAPVPAEQRLPTREQIANRPKADVPTTCVLCWQERREELENGLCSECRHSLRDRIVALVAENARLKQQNAALREYNDRLRFDLEQRDAEIKRAWQSADQLATAVSDQHDEIARLQGLADG